MARRLDKGLKPLVRRRARSVALEKSRAGPRYRPLVVGRHGLKAGPCVNKTPASRRGFPFLSRRRLRFFLAGRDGLEDFPPRLGVGVPGVGLLDRGAARAAEAPP